MPRSFLLLAAIVLTSTLRAEDPAPAPVAMHSTREVVDTPWVQAVRGYAKEKGLAVKEEGAGPVRYLLIGGADPGDLKHPLELAQKALLDLETATGMQETFTSKNPAPEEIYWLAVFNDNGQVGGMIDYARGHQLLGKPEGEDLQKKLCSFSTRNRVYVAPLERVRPLFNEWSVYATVCVAVDAFYAARDPKRGAPTWLREGLAAEEQRLLCKSIRCTTIAYEDKQFPMSDDWRNDVAKLMRSGDRQNKIATELLRMPLDSLPNVFYQQMWSLCTFVRGACGTGKTKAGKNKFREILDATAAGESSEDALKAVFGRTDPALTNAWRQWAQSWK